MVLMLVNRKCRFVLKMLPLQTVCSQLLVDRTVFCQGKLFVATLLYVLWACPYCIVL